MSSFNTTTITITTTTNINTTTNTTITINTNTTITTAAYVPLHKRGLLSPPDTLSFLYPSLVPHSSSTPKTRDLSRFWRTGAAPLSSSSNGNLPSFDNVNLGIVFFLPDQATMEGSRIHGRLQGSAQDPWSHPAVVVAKQQAADGVNCVDIRLCTSFDGTHVEEKKPPHHQGFFMLAENSQDNLPHGRTVLARMKPGSAKFSKRTYLNLSFNAIYTVEYNRLDPYNRKAPMQFDAISLERIMAYKHIGNIKSPMV